MASLKILWGAVSALALTSAAFAADLPTRKGMAPPPYQAPYAFTWAGPYIGAFAGGNWASLNSTDTFGGVNVPKLNSNGLTAGGLAGFNWAFPGASSFVIGAEVEAGYDRLNASTGYAGFGGVPTTLSEQGSAEGRARGRIGFAWDHFLLFGAGGASVHDLRLSAGIPGFGAQQSFWRGGWNVGGGVDWAFNEHWVLRGEYIYDRFGKRTYNFFGQNPAFDNIAARAQESTARAALMYKF